jgi:hypothetical protein
MTERPEVAQWEIVREHRDWWGYEPFELIRVEKDCVVLDG